MKPIIQRLRNIEMNYSMPGPDHAAIRQARHLITDLWELHWGPPDADINEEAKKLFEAAGMGMKQEP